MLLAILSNVEFPFAYFLFIFRNDITMKGGRGRSKMTLSFFLICTSPQCIHSSAQGIFHYLNSCPFSLSCQRQILSIEISLFVQLTLCGVVFTKKVREVKSRFEDREIVITDQDRFRYYLEYVCYYLIMSRGKLRLNLPPERKSVKICVIFELYVSQKTIMNSIVLLYPLLRIVASCNTLLLVFPQGILSTVHISNSA